MHPIEMHERTAAVVRTAIDQTIDRLEGLDGDTPLSDMLVTHLGVLLKIEDHMLSVAPTSNEGVVTTTTALWYPDDSGGWVETHGVDPELSDRLRVQLLAEIERDRKMYIPTAFLPSVVNWPRIVAYKVVSP